MHFLEREILLNAPAAEIWAFMATPVNLNELTPPDLHFKILSEVPGQMFNGLTILYEINIPIFGICTWLTEIKHIHEGSSFVDEQRVGPYKFWYHQHIIEPVEECKTRMIDKVAYQLPFAMIGQLLHTLWIKRKLDDIFDYRAEKLAALFG